MGDLSPADGGLVVKFRPIPGEWVQQQCGGVLATVTTRCLLKTLFPVVSILAVVAAYHALASSQSDMQKQSDVIVAAEREWAKAAVDHDIASFAKYMSDDYVLIEVKATPGKQPQFGRHHEVQLG